jgi:hypothetical protein
MTLQIKLNAVKPLNPARQLRRQGQMRRHVRLLRCEEVIVQQKELGFREALKRRFTTARLRRRGLKLP